MDVDLQQMSRHSTYRNYAYLTENDLRDGMQPCLPQERSSENKNGSKYDFQRIISYLGSEYQEFDYPAQSSKKARQEPLTTRRLNKAIDK